MSYNLKNIDKLILKYSNCDEIVYLSLYLDMSPCKVEEIFLREKKNKERIDFNYLNYQLNIDISRVFNRKMIPSNSNHEMHQKLQIFLFKKLYLISLLSYSFAVDDCNTTSKHQYTTMGIHRPVLMR